MRPQSSLQDLEEPQSPPSWRLRGGQDGAGLLFKHISASLDLRGGGREAVGRDKINVLWKLNGPQTHEVCFCLQLIAAFASLNDVL